MRLLREGRSTVAKFAGDFGGALEAQSLGALTLGRWVTDPEQWGEWMRHSPVEIAAYYAILLEPHIVNNPAINVWEHTNEFNPTSPTEMLWFASFEAEVTRLLWTRYQKWSAVGSFSVGTPDSSLHGYFKAALEAIKKYNGFLALHEYWNDRPESLTWLQGRYRRWIRDFKDGVYFDPAIKILITECGTDRLEGHGAPPRQMFVNAEGVFNPLLYANSLLGYELLIRQDPQVIGATIFKFGGSGFPDFQMEGTGLADYLIAWSKANPLTAPSPTPTPQPVKWIGRMAQTKTDARLRRGADEGYATITTLYAGTILPVKGETAGWIRVAQSGWVAKQDCNLV